MTISINRTTNSNGGDEFSYNNELSFYRNDELSNVGNEFYSPNENLVPSLKIGPLLHVSFFSSHQIPPKDEILKALEQFPSLSLIEFRFLKNLPSPKPVIVIHIPSGSSRGLCFHPNCISWSCCPHAPRWLS